MGHYRKQAEQRVHSLLRGATLDGDLCRFLPVAGQQKEMVHWTEPHQGETGQMESLVLSENNRVGWQHL